MSKVKKMFPITITILLSLFFFTACNERTNIYNYNVVDQNTSREQNSSCNETTNIYNYYVVDQNTSREQNSSEENNSSTPIKNSLKDIELYQPLLKQVNGSRQYDIDNFDVITKHLTPLSFEFESKSFQTLTQEQEIFVDGKQNSFANIEYKINAQGKLLAYLGNKELYTLSLLSTQEVNSTWIEGYRTNIDTTGKVHTIEKQYLSNFYIIEKLVSSDVFESLEAFTQKYEKKIFLGDYFRGLTFGSNNKLKELNHKKSTDAGTYEIKTVNEQDILMIYPTNSQYYYADDSCYILNFSRVWKAKCYFKGSKDEQLFYDKDAYDDFLFYLKDKFISVNVSI